MEAMKDTPFTDLFSKKVAKKQRVADTVDHLNYYVTSLALAFFATAITTKQMYGSSIQCWVPMNFDFPWEDYTEDYCFIASLYHVPMEEEIEDHHRGDQISYYRWVPIMLTVQAFCFFVPNYLWNILHRFTAIAPSAIVEEATRIVDLRGDEREVETNKLAENIMDSVKGFQNAHSSRFSRPGRNAANLYVGIKVLYILNLVAQLLLLNKFLGGNFFNWIIETISSLAHGTEWMDNEIFPRSILCDFRVRTLGNVQNYTVQCVIMMNAFNEKMYLMMFLWFVLLLSVTIVNACFYIAVLSYAPWRLRLIIAESEARRHHLKYEAITLFVLEYLNVDGVLLIKFIREHAGDRIARELTNCLLMHHAPKWLDLPSSNRAKEHIEMLPLEGGEHNLNKLPYYYEASLVFKRLSMGPSQSSLRRRRQSAPPPHGRIFGNGKDGIAVKTIPVQAPHYKA